MPTTNRSRKSRGEILVALQYWVGQANAARAAIAYIRAFEVTRKSYISRVEGQGGERSNPKFSPVARVALKRKAAAVDEIILFSVKSQEQNSQGYGVKEIKNDIKGLMKVEPKLSKLGRKLLDVLSRNCKDQSKMIEARIEPLIILRNKFVAHSDINAIYELDMPGTRIYEMIELAEAIISSLEMLCRAFEYLTPQVTFSERQYMTIRAEKFDQFDAEEFWNQNFASWAN